MDYELLFALLILWTATTACLLLFVDIAFNHEDGSFHPHCVDVETRHYGFIVVKADTACKKDCAVKSISSFIAPRGSSSSKYFGSILVIIAVSGMFGSFRWYMIGDADMTQAILSVTGFSFLLLICAFESDVSPERFLEDKLMVTVWFLERLGAESVLDFPLNVYNAEFRCFIRKSKLRPLFEEFDRFETEQNRISCGADKLASVDAAVAEDFPYKPWWAVVHMLGALAYLGCVAAGIILNDVNDDDIYGVAYVMILSFSLFSIMGYLTGTYMPLLRPLRGVVLVWNPFCRDRNYIASLREAVVEYILVQEQIKGQPIQSVSRLDEQTEKESEASPVVPRSKRRSLRRLSAVSQNNNSVNGADETIKFKHIVDKSNKNTSLTKINELMKKMEANSNLGEKTNIVVRWIFQFYEREPEQYLRYTSLLFVMLELIAMLTPAVAIGLQWATALCPGSPMQSILDLFSATIQCLSVSKEQCEMSMRDHCIVRI